MKHRDSQKRHFIVMLKLIHPADRTIMKEPACFIGYALWISIGCHASYPLRWWQAAFPMHMQSVICHLWVLMKRIKYEESYIQTDGRCNIHIRQPYVQHFPYWFLIRLNWNFIGKGASHETHCNLPDYFEDSQKSSGSHFIHSHPPASALWTKLQVIFLTVTKQINAKKKRTKDVKICGMWVK